VQFVGAAFLTIGKVKRNAFFAEEKSPTGKITQAQSMISSREDGIQTGDGKAGFEYGGGSALMPV